MMAFLTTINVDPQIKVIIISKTMANPFNTYLLMLITGYPFS